MNNPATHYAPPPYGYPNPMPQGSHVMMSQAPPQFYPQHSYPPTSIPTQFQTPPHQQHQHQHQHQQSQQFYPQQQQPGYQRPPSQNSVPNFPQQQPTPKPRTPPTSGPEHRHATPPASAPSNNAMAQVQMTPNQNLAQQAQIQNAAQMNKAIPQPTPTLSPQSQQREKARVTVLLDINTALLKEVVSLQSQGKAGAAPGNQQSPTSPTSATDPNNALTNSPVDASKQNAGKPASQEYADCMRRLQANLSYLAAIADAKKKANGSVPLGPAILIPPPHLKEVHQFYTKLNELFPEASQSKINQAMAFASQQANKSAHAVSAQG